MGSVGTASGSSAEDNSIRVIVQDGLASSVRSLRIPENADTDTIYVNVDNVSEITELTQYMKELDMPPITVLMIMILIQSTKMVLYL